MKLNDIIYFFIGFILVVYCGFKVNNELYKIKEVKDELRKQMIKGFAMGFLIICISFLLIIIYMGVK